MKTVAYYFGINNIYEYTTAILGIISLIMGITLFALSRSLINSGKRSKAGLTFFAMAMVVLSVINLLEYTIGVDLQKEWHSLSIVVFAASIELFLMFAAYMSMLHPIFATRRRIGIEMGSIILFTAPSLFVSRTNNPLLFDLLFAVGIVFFLVKFICNYLEYRRLIKTIKRRVENLFSDDSSQWFKWIKSTFGLVLIIGFTSVIAPITNLTILVFYNTFLLFAYFYVYLSIILNISMFDKSMTILDRDEIEEKEENEIQPLPEDECHAKTLPFLVGREVAFNKWIESRGFTIAKITATEVATLLNTNRNRLSQFLKDELNTTYYEWIATLRIEEAKRQLEEHPTRSVYEIALNVGIEDRDNFRRTFHRYVGVSPTTYRKEYLDKQARQSETSSKS